MPIGTILIQERPIVRFIGIAGCDRDNQEEIEELKIALSKFFNELFKLQAALITRDHPKKQLLKIKKKHFLQLFRIECPPAKAEALEKLAEEILPKKIWLSSH